MKILLVTQDEPFFLGKSIDYLYSLLPDNCQIKDCILLAPSPFGKKESFLEKLYKTYSIFGLRFFIFYSFKFLLAKLNPHNNLKKVLSKHNCNTHFLSSSINSRESLTLIRTLQPDLLISIAGNQIFKKKLLSIPEKGSINLHTALLPKYRGLMPSFWVLKHQEKSTGVSVFFIDEGIDSGPIIIQQEIEIHKMSQYQLIKLSKKIGMEAMAKAIIKIESGDYDLIENPDENASYFTFPTKQDVKSFRAVNAKFF